MVENDDAGKPSCYWICYKTQLLRCAPHHCRPDFHALATNAIDNLQEAKTVIQQIKSRGVTRYLDLNKVNKQHIDDVEEDEEMISNGSDVEQDANGDAWTCLLHLQFPMSRPLPMMLRYQFHLNHMMLVLSLTRCQLQSLNLDSITQLQFHLTSLRPYERPNNAADLANVAFQVEDISSDGLPAAWHFKPETGYFELRPGTVNRGFWEIKAGCLLRHHVHPRKTLFDPHGFNDIPIPVEKLDSTRVTVHRTIDGQISSFTDDFRGCQHFAKDLRKHQLPPQWFGITVFQICAETRKELGMSAYDQRSSAKKVAQDSKVQQKRSFRRDYAKAKGEVSEKNLTQAALLPCKSERTSKLFRMRSLGALEILGASPDTRMFLKKPVYGQVGAPRRWYLEALRRLESLNWKRHQLDPCLFMLFDETALENDFPKLVGLLILHVLEYCGVKPERKNFAWAIHQEEYWQKVKPVTIHKGRTAENEMNDHDKSQLRALLGSLQWPSVQTAPHVQCSTSLISGMQKTNKLRAIIEANQLLKFAKQNLDLRPRYEPLKINSLDDLRLCIMFDAAHGAREDHTSSYLAFLTADEIFENETDYHILEWRSFKLPRVAHSSLSAEAQSCGQSADVAEYICRFWSCLRRPTEKLRDCMDEVSTLKPCLITDAKALYDSYHKESLAGSSSVDKRTGLEIRVAREQVSSLNGTLKWVSSERQYADSLTKMSSRALLAERIRFHKMKLVWEPQYVSAKKKNAAEREANRHEFAKPKERKNDSQHTTSSTSPTRPTSTEFPSHPNMFEECDVEMNEQVLDETYEPAEPFESEETYEPVEAYAGFPSNVKLLVYALTCFTMPPAASALHDQPLDHEHGRWGIWILVTILVLLLFCLVYAFGHRRGMRNQRARQTAVLDEAFASLDSLRERNDQNEAAYQLVRLELQQIRSERDQLAADRRSANVMAIVLDQQMRRMHYMVGRIDRLRSLIMNHEAPCPLGDSVLVQENKDGAQWHLDPDCPCAE
eukprot:s1562_g2.t1